MKTLKKITIVLTIAGLILVGSFVLITLPSFSTKSEKQSEEHMDSVAWNR